MPKYTIHEFDLMWISEENWKKKRALHGSGKARGRSQPPRRGHL